MSRLFGERIPERDFVALEKENDVEKMLQWIQKNEIGQDEIIETPFGKRQLLYCDYSASARAFRPIEDYIISEVLPLYGNTHSSVTVSAEQTTLFVHEARQEIRAMVGAGDNDDVIFCGSGSTAAVELLIHLLDLGNDFIVIHSMMEHHSNLLPWRRAAKKCYLVDDKDGSIDPNSVMYVLSEARKIYPDLPVVCAFTACSNLTGICSKIDLITKICKEFSNTFIVWDFASAAPYVEVNVNGSVPIDAIFFSGHKFIGGVSTPGVLCVKKQWIRVKEPKRSGGGTVSFVNSKGEWFLKEAEHREEGGTSDAVGIVRLALAVKLKRAVGAQAIAQRNHQIVRKVVARVSQRDDVVLLGPPKIMNRHPVFSFLVRHRESGLFFHHNYISVLLNDLFGIQSRAGCMCAGPYSQELLGISTELSEKFLEALKESEDLDRTHLRRGREYTAQEMLRPGFTRISIPYFWSDSQVDYVLDAIEHVSKLAANFLHLYQLNAESGEYHHHSHRTFHARKWLGFITITPKGLEVEKPKTNSSLEFVSFDQSFEEAKRRSEEAKKDLTQKKNKIPDGREAIPTEFAPLRWFVLAVEHASGRCEQTCPFTPKTFEKSEESEEENVMNEPATCSIAIEKENHEETEEEPDSIACGSATEEEVVCPLNPAEREDVRMGEFGTDESPDDTKNLDDWNRRVVVTRKDITPAEEKQLPWKNPSLEMYKKVTDAIHGLDMIKEGDKVLVCLSGGKDSLSMLHILHFYQERNRKNKGVNFELGAITVDPGSTAYNPRPLIEYCRSLNIDYFYEEQDIIGAARKVQGLRSICAFCSRMKRGRLAAAAQLHGWNVLALGQHLDDVVESFFIAAFQNGNLSTMKAQYTSRDGAIRVIRPLIFLREKALRDFAEQNSLPVVAENCPACFNQATERHRIKQLLAQQELIFPDLFNSLRSAMRPLLLVDSASTDQMRAKAIENIAKQNKGKAK